MTEEIRAMKLQHWQESGYDRLSIYNPDGQFECSAAAKVKGTPLESAVGALWVGVDYAFSLAPEYEAKDVIVYSDVEGAVEHFGREWDEIGEAS